MLETHGASLRAALLSTGLVLGAGLLSGLTPSLAQAQSLPEPYVSRALDAVLLPIDAAVVAAFSLDSGTTGALILATQPGGLAEAAGFLPGDVIETVKSRKVASPIEVDEIVLYWITTASPISALTSGAAGRFPPPPGSSPKSIITR